MPAPPPPNEAGGCWKELPETLAKKKAIWNPQNEDHRCFVWCVLAHCLGVVERQKAVSCSGSFFYPELAGRRGPRPPGWQLALADAGVDFSGLPMDRPVNFDDIDSFDLRNAGRVEVFVFVWQQTLGRTGWSTTTSSSSAPRAARASYRAASPAQRPLQPDPQLPGAGRQAGADSGSHTHRRLHGVQVPKAHGPLCQEGLLAAAPHRPVLSRCRCPGPRRACCATGARPPQSSRP